MSEFDPNLPPRLPVELPPPASPLWARLLNLLAMPGAVFDELKASRHAVGNWLVPLFISALGLAATAWVVASSPAFSQRVAEQQTAYRTAQTNLVTSAKLTPAQLEENLKAFDTMSQPAVLNTLAVVGGFGLGVMRIFWWALILWFIARWLLRQPVGYGKALEVAGLSSIVTALGSVVLVVTMVNFGASFAPEGFKLVVNDLSAGINDWPTILALNITNFWVVAVMGLGLARLTGVPWFRAAFPVLIYWLAMQFLAALLGVFGA
jgi:hypothetical protein